MSEITATATENAELSLIILSWAKHEDWDCSFKLHGLAYSTTRTTGNRTIDDYVTVR
jgi:hypothetical protein